MNEGGPSTLPEAFFLATEGGQRFCLFYPATTSVVRDPLLFLHPFAEELNTTRRIVARQARAMARAGHPVLQIDLGGCGDSEGRFEDATWAGWCQDASVAQTWLRERTGGQPWLWGLRAGALLATHLASAGTEPGRLLLWQPVSSGAQMLQQFLRLASAGQWIGSQESSTTPSAQKRLQEGQAVTIAGYTLNPELAHDLSLAKMEPGTSHGAGRLIWLDLTPHATTQITPAAARQLDIWRAAGWQVHGQAVQGPAFWQTVGLDDAPGLIDATLAALDRVQVSAAT
jgi:uncharacterized protein